MLVEAGRATPVFAAPLALMVVVACAGDPAARAPLGEAARLEAFDDQGPSVGDAPPALRVAFRLADGALVPVDVAAAAFVPRWRDGAALIDPERRLYQVWPDGRRRMLAGNATALATDGERLAFVVVAELHAELFVHDGEEARSLTTGLASAGVLRVERDRVLFVGATAGGVAGVWVAEETDVRCVTNCELRTGEPWLDRFVPPPSDPALLEAP